MCLELGSTSRMMVCEGAYIGEGLITALTCYGGTWINLDLVVRVIHVEFEIGLE